MHPLKSSNPQGQEVTSKHELLEAACLQVPTRRATTGAPRPCFACGALSGEGKGGWHKGGWQIYTILHVRVPCRGF